MASEKINLEIEDLKSQLNELKLKISMLRKKGIDVSIASLKLMLIPPKIKLAEITKEYKDIQKVNLLVQQARAEIPNNDNPDGIKPAK